MNDPTLHHRLDIGSPRRLEALVDGVFAIVMTLLVFQIAVPHGPERLLAHDLAALAPTFLTYAITFVTLGVLWFGNRTQGELVVRADHTYVWRTLAMLGLVALVPFSAALLGAFPTSRTAVIVYGAHLTAVYATHGSLWTYVTRRRWLLRDGVPEAYLRRTRFPAFAAALGYAVATALGAAVPVAGVVVFLLVPVPFVGGLFYRWLARVHAQVSTTSAASAAGRM